MMFPDEDEEEQEGKRRYTHTVREEPAFKCCDPFFSLL
jgi:hypothetical protein